MRKVRTLLHLVESHKMVFLLLWLLFHRVPTHAQREADNWYFGQQTGFSFRAGSPPTPIMDGKLSTIYACATASDPTTGQLLFYSNAEQIWNRAHQLMPNGDALRGTNFTTQGALIVPMPGDEQRYYLFTLRQRVRGNGSINDPKDSKLFYSVVDMRLAGGQGDVAAASKNTPLDGLLTEKLTAVRHTNGRDYWVLAHEWGSNAFLVYAVTAQGVAAARRQNIGPAHPAIPADTALPAGMEGQLQASPDGRKLASAVAFGRAREPFCLFDFDAGTGTLSNFTDLGLLRDGFGVCFSPDNTRLYVQNFNRTPDQKSLNIISQYDLTAGNGAAIAASGQSIIADNPNTNISAMEGGSSFYTLQNGPDGRIYGGSGYRGPGTPAGDTGLQTFHVIGKPNARGFACEVRFKRFDFDNRPATGGLPNFMQHTFNGLQPAPDPNSSCNLSSVQLFPNPSAGQLQLQLPEGCTQTYAVSLFDSIGQLVATYTTGGESGRPPLNISTLAAGLYVVEVRTGRQKATSKLIKL